MRRKLYDEKDLNKAVENYLNGMKMKQVLLLYPQVPERTIFDRAKKKKSSIQQQKPGPKPIPTVGIENDLVAWIVAMQSHGVPVGRDTILTRANEIYTEMYGTTRTTGFLTRGWVDRFMNRHPNLSLRCAQVIKRVRSEATGQDLMIFFTELMKHVIERKVTSDRIFNMDETGFAQKTKSKKVIALKGSRNVWSKSTEASFHLTVVAAGSASGFVVPPLFLLPGKHLIET
jgi:hypothetical protein